MNARQESHIEEFPTLKQELERKAFEQLERLVVQLDRGEISMAQFETGVKTVWNCVSGLVDQGLINTIEEVNKHCKTDFSFVDCRIFIKENRVGFITRKYGGDTVSVKIDGTSGIGYPMSFKDELIPSQKAKEEQDRLTTKFLNNGWKRRI